MDAAVAAVPAANQVAGGIAEDEKDAAAQPPAADVAITADHVPGRRMIKLPQGCIDWIMSQKRHVLEDDPDEYYERMMSDPDRHEIYTQEYLEEERQLMRDLAAFYQRSGDRLEKFQQRVRLEFEEKGFVEIDEVCLDQAINYRESFKQLCDAFMQVDGFIYDEDDVVKQMVNQLVAEEVCRRS